MFVFQIAAKIGGDAGPPVNNSTASDGFPFTAQKRQLEDAGSDGGTASPPLGYTADNGFSIQKIFFEVSFTHTHSCTATMDICCFLI